MGRVSFRNTIGFNITKERNFLEDRVLKRLVASKHDDVGIDAHTLKLLDRVLSGFDLCSSDPLKNGTRVTCIKRLFSLPTSREICRTASRKG